jgi:hypothetical protein
MLQSAMGCRQLDQEGAVATDKKKSKMCTAKGTTMTDRLHHQVLWYRRLSDCGRMSLHLTAVQQETISEESRDDVHWCGISTCKRTTVRRTKF